MARQVNLDTAGLFRIFEHPSSSIVTNSNWCLTHVQRQRGPSSESGHYRFVQTFEHPSIVTFYPTFMSLKQLSKLYQLFRPPFQGFIVIPRRSRPISHRTNPSRMTINHPMNLLISFPPSQSLNSRSIPDRLKTRHGFRLLRCFD